MSKAYSFDSKCLELAEHFLPSQATQSVKNELAQTIQNAVEDFCLIGGSTECRHCDGTGFRMTHPAGVRERCFACTPFA